MLCERGTRFGAVTGDDVQRSRRKADLGREHGDSHHGQACILCRFDDARVACCQRGADAAAENLHRIVPRHDVAGDAMRLAQRQHRHAGLVRNRVAVQLVGRAGVVLEVARQRGRIGAPLLQRLAGGARFEPRELVVMIDHRVRQLHQQTAALGSRHASPGAVEELSERTARCKYRGVDVGGVAARDLCERRAVGWIDHVDRLPGGRCDPAIADKVMRTRGGCVAVHRVLLTDQLGLLPAHLPRIAACDSMPSPPAVTFRTTSTSSSRFLRTPIRSSTRSTRKPARCSSTASSPHRCTIRATTATFRSRWPTMATRSTCL